jgi:hypothetical protein
MNNSKYLHDLLKECFKLLECEVDQCPFNGYQRDDWDKPGRRCICSHNCYERAAALVPRLRAALEADRSICATSENPPGKTFPLGDNH